MKRTGGKKNGGQYHNLAGSEEGAHSPRGKEKSNRAGSLSHRLGYEKQSSGAVASAVTAIYKIKKSEITPQSKNAEGKKKKVASIKVVGETIEDLALVYRGNRLTPTHFGMTPTAPTPGQKKGITVEIFKGQKRALQGKPEYSRPAFLASNGHGAYLPFSA